MGSARRDTSSEATSEVTLGSIGGSIGERSIGDNDKPWPSAAAMLAGLPASSRLASLEETGLLDTPSLESLDRVVRIGSAAVHACVSLVSLVDDHRQFFTSQLGLPEPWASARETPLSHSFCQYVVVSEIPLVVSDARVHPVLKDNLAIRDLHVVAYAGMPIRAASGEVLGSFCAIDDKPKIWSERELMILQDLASIVSAEIELRRRARRAERSEAELAATNARLENEQEASWALSRRIGHDLRAPLSVIRLGVSSLLTHEAARTLPELERLLVMLDRNARHAASLLAAIDASEQKGAGERVEVSTVLRDTCADFSGQNAGVSLTVDCPESELIVEASPSDMRRCIENLVSNAQRFAWKRIVVRAKRHGNVVAIAVEDDGPGLPDDAAYERAWETSRRFHVNEGKSGSGLGLSIVREIVERCGGRVEAKSSPLGGACFGFSLPAAC
ncbi:GAF domain-containing sensor histidine kinase [Labilithrix luteola]|uniref:GAF domain-containing sensor histidine kinase n=1 Tax=Labilithrix luteola TaxID=1391654 RepID=UPI000A8DFA50|nr:GAF domain-containing sensor histidine kinase [Labilithrix luteola]